MMTANRRITAIAGAAALVLVVIWYFTVWTPQSKNLKTAQKAHAAAQQKVGQLQTQVGQLEGLVKLIPADNAKFVQLQAELPDNPQLDTALRLLHQAAIQAGVQLTTLSPATSSSSGGGSSTSSGAQAAGTPAVTLTMSALGSMDQVKAFLGALSAMPRTVVVDRFSISSGVNAAANITARIFYAGQPTP